MPYFHIHLQFLTVAEYSHFHSPLPVQKDSPHVTHSASVNYSAVESFPVVTVGLLSLFFCHHFLTVPLSYSLQKLPARNHPSPQMSSVGKYLVPEILPASESYQKVPAVPLVLLVSR